MFDAIRQYSVPLVLALVLHGLAGMALYANWNPADREKRIIEPPRAVQSSLIVLEPEPAPARTPPPQPKPQPKPEPAQPKPDPAAEQAKREAEAKR